MLGENRMLLRHTCRNRFAIVLPDCCTVSDSECGLVHPNLKSAPALIAPLTVLLEPDLTVTPAMLQAAAMSVVVYSTMVASSAWQQTHLGENPQAHPVNK